MAGTGLGPSLTRRRFLIAAASGIGAAGFGGALGACGRPFSEPTEITAWLFPGGQGQGSPQQAVVDVFHK